MWFSHGIIFIYSYATFFFESEEPVPVIHIAVLIGESYKDNRVSSIRNWLIYKKLSFI